MSLDQRVRLRDVAEVAGVSEATASRVINQRAGVSPQTRRAVEDALEQLAYVPRRSHSRTESSFVGLIIPELENPIFPAFAQSLETCIARHGLVTVLCTSTPEGMQEPDYVDNLLEHGVAGIIFVCGQHADTSANHSGYERLWEMGMPMVLINGHFDKIPAPSLSTDDTAAMDLAVRHLAQLGHKRIGMASGQRRFVAMGRKIDGYLAAMERCFGHADSDLIVETVFSIEGGHQAATNLVRRDVTAIIAGSDIMALGAINAINDHGLGVPDDVSVVGFDDTPLLGFTNPPLTTLRQPVREISVAAAQTLADQIRQQHNGSIGEYLFKPELIVRNSTAPVRNRLEEAG